VRRRLFKLATVLSLVLLVATVAMWVRSYWISDSFEWVSHYRTRFIAISGGRVLLQVNHGPSGNQEFSAVDHYAYVKKANETAGVGRPWRFGGFWIENLSFAPRGSRSAWLPYTDFVVPLYAVILVSLILPGVMLRRGARERKRKRVGLCARCGYDLRATPECCPECGAMASVAVTR
jgi:hypothetical protein